MQLSRSIYLERFRQFADFAFADGDAYRQHGAWRNFFCHRIGPAFDGRVILEVGCFDVTYLLKIAARYPHSAFVGLDWKCKPLYDGAQRIAALGMSNIALLRAPAQHLLKIVAPGELDEIWVFHPDPCSRDVELKNRLISEPFLLDVHQALRDHSSFLALKTDHPGYYQWVLGLLGLPQPAIFLDPSTTTTSAGGAIRPYKLRVRDLMPVHQIPKPSRAVQSRFQVAMNSFDFWQDPAAQYHCAGRCFAGEATLFESRFINKRQPIYYCELQKR